MSDVRDPETDQAAPVVNDNPFIQDLVALDIEERKQFGIRKYGTALQAGNGRNMLQDAYEEALDLVIYLRGLLAEGTAADQERGEPTNGSAEALPAAAFDYGFVDENPGVFDEGVRLTEEEREALMVASGFPADLFHAVKRIIAARLAEVTVERRRWYDEGVSDGCVVAEAGLRAELADARGAQREWEEWSNELATLLPEDAEGWPGVNPEGAQESIIEAALRHLLALAAHQSAPDANDREVLAKAWRAGELAEQVAAVTSLHARVAADETSRASCLECETDWPCPTVTALTGWDTDPETVDD